MFSDGGLVGANNSLTPKLLRDSNKEYQGFEKEVTTDEFSLVVDYT